MYRLEIDENMNDLHVRFCTGPTHAQTHSHTYAFVYFVCAFFLYSILSSICFPRRLLMARMSLDFSFDHSKTHTHSQARLLCKLMEISEQKKMNYKQSNTALPVEQAK